MNNNIAVIVSGILLVAALTALFVRDEAPAISSEEKIRVTASFYPLYFLAQEIGGDRVAVENITPAGAEPHEYEPTARELVRMEQADLVILQGGGLEAWGDRVRQNLAGKTLIVTAGEGLTTQRMRAEGEDIVDPHAWLSPALMMRMADTIEAGFAQADPANAAHYAANAAALKAKLRNLDTEYRRGLAACAKKDIITSHAAFGYLASAYGLNQVPIAGLDPEAEPSPRELAAIAAFAKRNDVKTIFFEELVSPKLAQTIATEVGAKTSILHPLEGLAEEDLAAGKNYLTEMRRNLANLKDALHCL